MMRLARRPTQLFIAALAAVVGLTLAAAAHARTQPSVHISGPRLVGLDRRQRRLIGVNRSGTEYACSGPVQGGGFGYGIFQGPVDARSVRAPRRLVSMPARRLHGRRLSARADSFWLYQTAVNRRWSTRFEPPGARQPIIISGPEKVMSTIDSIRQSYLAWTWDTVQDHGGCSNALLDDPGTQNGFPAGYYSGQPSGFGRGVRAHLRQIR